MTAPRDPIHVPPLTEQARVGWWRLVPLPLAMSAMLAASGCAGDATGPTSVEQPVIKPDPLLPNGADLSAMVSDAVARAVLGLPEGPDLNEMTAVLGQLALVVETKSITYVRLAYSAADAALTRYESLLVDDYSGMAELGAIRLTLDLIAVDMSFVAGN